MFALLGGVSLGKAAGTAAQSLPTYTVVDLGTLGGEPSDALGVNDAGEVVGQSSTAGRSTHAFAYVAGRMVDLDPGTGNASQAVGINNSGEVVVTGGSGRNEQGLVYRDGKWRSLGVPSRANAVNDAGDVVGGGVNGTTLFMHDGTQLVLGALPGQTTSAAYAINNADEAAGYSGSHAVLFRNRQVIDLGTLGGSASIAYGINDAGTVVGESRYTASSSNGTHAFVSRNGQMTDLGALAPGGLTHADDINNRGEIVGTASLGAGISADLHAFYSEGTSIVDLNSLISCGGCVVTMATAINDKGQIVGGGVINGHHHAFLLNPAGVGSTSGGTGSSGSGGGGGGGGGGGAGGPSFKVAISGASSGLPVGSAVTLSVAVTNGGGNADSATLHLSLSGLQFVSANVDRGSGCSGDGGSVTCLLDFFNSGLSASEKINVRVTSLPASMSASVTSAPTGSSDITRWFGAATTTTPSAPFAPAPVVRGTTQTVAAALEVVTPLKPIVLSKPHPALTLVGSLTKAARLRFVLVDRKGHVLAKWTRRVESGTFKLSLLLPPPAKNPGTDRLRIALVSGKLLKSLSVTLHR